MQAMAQALCHPADSACADGDAMPRKKLRPKSEAIGNNEAASGYMPDGVSMHSHGAAKGRANAAKGFRDRPPEQLSRLDHLILHELNELARVERALTRETDPERVAHFIRKRTETQKFLTRLRTEQKGLV